MYDRTEEFARLADITETAKTIIHDALVTFVDLDSAPLMEPIGDGTYLLEISGTDDGVSLLGDGFKAKITVVVIAEELELSKAVAA